MSQGVKVLFELDQSSIISGSEAMWCDPMMGSEAILDNVPLFLFGLGLGDRISIKNGANRQAYFDKLISQSGNRTFRFDISETSGTARSSLVSGIRQFSDGKGGDYAGVYFSYNIPAAIDDLAFGAFAREMIRLGAKVTQSSGPGFDFANLVPRSQASEERWLTKAANNTRPSGSNAQIREDSLSGLRPDAITCMHVISGQAPITLAARYLGDMDGIYELICDAEQHQDSELQMVHVGHLARLDPEVEKLISILPKGFSTEREDASSPWVPVECDPDYRDDPA